MRKTELTFTALLIPLDALALLCAAVAAYALRFSKPFVSVRPILTDIPFADYFATSCIFIGVWMLIFALAGLYALRRRPAWDEFGRLIVSCTAGIMVVISSVFFGREFTTSRFVVLAVWGLAIFFVTLFRMLLRAVRHTMLKNGRGHKLIAIVGSGRAAQELAKLYRERPIIGFTVVKTYKEWTEAARRDVLALQKRGKLDGLVLADPDATKEQELDLIALTEQHHLEFRYLADLFAGAFKRVEISTAGGVPVIEVKRTPLDGWGRIAKRLFDLVVSGILIILTSPIMIVTAIAIKLTSRGPILFSRLENGSPVKRVGEHGRPFRYFKFRSMYHNVHSQRYTALAHLDTRKGPLVKIKNDPRVTPVGRFIRTWSIDELPEFFLVFFGRMSLVGPRPHLPEEVANYEPHQRRVLAIKPGITGLAQISGRSDLSFDDEVNLDLWYIEHWSLWRDLWILFRTPMAILTHRGVEQGA